MVETIAPSAKATYVPSRNKATARFSEPACVLSAQIGIQVRRTTSPPHVAKQADDDSLRRYADRIQARAIRRSQELLKQFPQGGGINNKYLAVDGADEGSTTRRQAAKSAGMSDRQYRTAMDVGHVPEAAVYLSVESRPRALEENQQILDMYLRCYRQDAIAVSVDIDRTSVTKKIDDCVKNANFGDSHIFDNFKPEIYTSASRARARSGEPCIYR